MWFTPRQVEDAPVRQGGDSAVGVYQRVEDGWVMAANHSEFSIANYPTSQGLAELELWSPPQGTQASMVPVNVDVRFNTEPIVTPKHLIKVYAKRAQLVLTLNGATLVRGSAFGDEIRDPYVTVDVTESARKIIESETQAELKGEFGLERSFFGKITAVWNARRRRSDKQENDRIVNAALRAYRLSYRGRGKWLIVEPITPNLLIGKYLGDSWNDKDGEKSTPLCFLTFRKPGDRADLRLLVSSRDLAFHWEQGVLENLKDKNKEVIIETLLRRSIKNGMSSLSGAMPAYDGGGIVLCLSTLELKNAS